MGLLGGRGALFAGGGIALLVVCGALILWGNRMADYKNELEDARDAIATDERIDDADVGRGDRFDDDLWLCKRAGSCE